MKLKNPIREIRKAMTPPCTQCVHSRFKAFNSVTILCDSGAYLDHVERTCCERYDNFVAMDVREVRQNALQPVFHVLPARILEGQQEASRRGMRKVPQRNRL